MEMHIYPAEPVYEVQMRESGNPHHHPQIIEDLKDEARRRGLWNLFQPHPQWGPGLSNLEYAPLAEIMGRSPQLAPEACNCNAPDTGNMEVLTLFGTDEHKDRSLRGRAAARRGSSRPIRREVGANSPPANRPSADARKAT